MYENGPDAPSRAAVRTQLRVAAAFLAMVLLSYAIRVPHLNRPLSEHQEWITAHSLIALENLQTQGFLKHHGSMLQTYPGESNRYVQNPVMRLMDAQGYWYYTSFPPLSIVLPFFIFHVTGLAASVGALQVFNLFLHALAAWTILRILVQVLERGPASPWVALAGSVVFLFLPANLWYFSNAYSWDTFWHVPWVFGIWAFIRAHREAEAHTIRPSAFLLLGVSTFCVVYAEYQGLLFAASGVLYLLFSNKPESNRVHRILIVVLCTAALAALLLTTWQYSSICGFEPFVARQARVFLQYSFLSSSVAPSNLLEDACHILRHYADGYDVAILALLPIAMALLLRAKPIEPLRLTRIECLLLYLALFPVVIHHVLMLHWTAVHDYSVVKTSVCVSLLVAVLLSKILRNYSVKSFGTIAALAGIALTLGASAYAYETRFTTEAHPIYIQAGEAIREKVTDAEVVFAISPAIIVPQIIYYAKRNIQSVKSLAEAQSWLQKHHRTQGIVFFFDTEYRIQRIERVSQDRDWRKPADRT